MVAIALFANLAHSAFAQSRVALLIGNSSYLQSGMELANPVNDVADLGAALRDLDFEVTIVTDARSDAMLEALRAFGSHATGADIAVFFYAGHGVQLGGQNHLIGTEFQGADPGSVVGAAITMEQVRNVVEAAKPDLGMIILDACRNNPFSSAGLVKEGLGRQSGASGLLIAYATDPGNVAFDGDEENSIFTQSLLEHVSTPGLDVRLMLGRVRQEVVLKTRGRQVPWVEEAVLGEHYFAPEDAAGADVDPLAVELAYWRTVSGAGDLNALVSYISRYPAGLFREFAEDQIAALRNRSGPVSANVAPAFYGVKQAAISAALQTIGLLGVQPQPSEVDDTEVQAALDMYFSQNQLEPGIGVTELYKEATRASMVLGATTLQRLRTDIVALQGVENTLGIAERALGQIREIAKTNPDAMPILAAAKNDVLDIERSRDLILLRLDQSRTYYDQILTRAIEFVPVDADASLIGAGTRSRDLLRNDRALARDAELFLHHVAGATAESKGSYAWLKDLLPEN